MSELQAAINRARAIKFPVTMNGGNAVDELNGKIEILLNRMTKLEEAISSLAGKPTPTVPKRPGHPRLEEITAAVCKYFNVTLEEIMSNRQVRYCTRPRQIALYLGLRLTKHSLVSLGKYFGRDHSTVINARERITVLRMRDAALEKSLIELEAILMGVRTA